MVEFIAEISNNHNGDRRRCLDLIQAAARCGCWGIEFPLFRVEQLFSPGVLVASSTHRQHRRWELPIHFLKDMARCAHDEGIKFGCTPYDLDSLKHLEFHADFLKVSCYELPWTTLVRRCAETGLPLVLATAMADARECWNSTEAALEAGCEDMTLLHGISNHPVKREDCNLAAIGTLRELLVREFEPTFSSTMYKAGWSDHSLDPGVVSRAIHYWGSDVISIPFDLDGRGEGASTKQCWLPEQASQIINGMTPPAGGECDGVGRLVTGPTEETNRAWRADPADGLRPTFPVRRTWPMVQPGALTKGPAFIFIPDGLGLGCITRSLAIAEELRKNHDAKIHFLIRGTPGQKRLLQRNGFLWITMEGEVTPVKAVAEMAFHPRLKEAVCVLDMVDDASGLTADLKEDGHPVVVIDQPGCLGADLVIMPSFGWNEDEELSAICRNIFGGTDYLLVRHDVTLLRPVKNPAYFEPRIVVSFGGADPNRLTEKMAKALAAIPNDVKVQFVIGPGFEDFIVRSAHLFMDHPTFEIIDTGDPLETVLPGAGLLITAPGVTIAEANTLGIPVAVLAHSNDEASAVHRLEKAGVIASLGLGTSATSDKLGRQVAELWRDAERRKEIAECGWRQVNGQGAGRTALLVRGLAGSI